MKFLIINYSLENIELEIKDGNVNVNNVLLEDQVKH